MNIVPSHKQDLDSCERLLSASDNEVLEHFGPLLAWLQDFNWPVAPKVLERILKLQYFPSDEINIILEGSDDIWKYYLISKFINKLPNESKSAYSKILKRIAKEPTVGEIKEEVNLVALEAVGENV